MIEPKCLEVVQGAGGAAFVAAEEYTTAFNKRFLERPKQESMALTLTLTLTITLTLILIGTSEAGAHGQPTQNAEPSFKPAS